MKPLKPLLLLLLVSPLLGCSSGSSPAASSSAHVSASVDLSFSQSGLHPIISSVPDGHGRLDFSKSQAVSGTEITVTATAEDGYFLSDISIEDGAADLLMEEEGKTYRFVMPDRAVAIDAVFSLFPASAS
ncbi:MAG: hypothetical protein LKK13_00250 [Bacilli bacterium]|nr:hypothetical protein [Bacilli bacterium]